MKYSLLKLYIKLRREPAKDTILIPPFERFSDTTIIEIDPSL